MGKGRSPCCDKNKVKRGPWSPQEDLKLTNFIRENGHTNWRSLPKQADLLRCGKSCRLRWLNYLRPDIKRGNFTKEEEEMIIKLHHNLGNKWSKIASYFPGRTDNEIKNVWNTHLRKRLNEKESDNTNLHKDETKELSKSSSFSSSSSSCISNFSHNENQETEDGTEGEKQENDISIEKSSPYSSASQDYILQDDLIDFSNIIQTVDTDFMINQAYQENYEMFFNPDQDTGIFPLDFDFDYLEMLEKEDPIYSYESQTKEFEISPINFEEGNESENECMKWMKNLENELLLDTSNEGDLSFTNINYSNFSC